MADQPINIIYGRIISKEECKLIKETKMLLSAEKDQLIPCFEATKFLSIADDLSQDDIRLLHRLLGGSGNAYAVCLFKPYQKPEVEGIPCRNSDKIKKLIGTSLRESRFKSETRIEIICWV